MKRSQTDCLKNLVAGLAVLLLFVMAAWYLNRPAADAVSTSASQQVFVRAKVTRVLADYAEADTWTEGNRLGRQELELEIRSGAYRGALLRTSNFLGAYNNVDVQEGSRVIVKLESDETNAPFVSYVFNYDRGPLVAGIILLFALLLGVIGGKRGVLSLLGLLFTLGAIWLILLPLILRGVHPIAAAVLIVCITSGVSLVLLGGFSKKTLCAMFGCVAGICIAGLVAGAVGAVGHLNGFNMEEAEPLVLQAGSTIHIRGLLVCCILISTLGAVLDVSMTIASAMCELREVNSGLTRKQLFRSGMNIGRDAMGATTNTLILAFAGSSLNLLLLFRIYDYPLIEVFNSDLMVMEILQGVTGAMGILLTVPLVAWFSARILLPANLIKAATGKKHHTK